MRYRNFILLSLLLAAALLPLQAQVAVKAETLHTAAGDAISDGVVLIEEGKISAVGPASQVQIPSGVTVLEAKVATPGLVDAHSVVGLAGYLNQNHDQDHLEESSPIQPELRALDAYNARETLVEWVRRHGVTTLHTGHGPGQLVSGQTMIVKTYGETVDDALMVPSAMLAATLGDGAKASGGRSPGSRSKMMALLRSEFIKAQDYLDKMENAEEGKEPARDLHKETLAKVLSGEMPLLVTAHRSRDILAAIRLAEEFGFNLVLDGAAEAHLITEKIMAADVPVILHAPGMRHFGEAENATFEAGPRLRDAGITFCYQTGYEGYVPKTRVLLFEAGWAASNGLLWDEALAAVTIDAARILGVDDRVGSLEVGKDGDVVLYDGDPFEYTTHVTGVIIDGQVVSQEKH
ncbi:MAG TPA: amidohydrolase family protein [Acidobacteriota bacterium]|nr:amidohydrolase family protein [Acidobacteriota bacterium]